jgi:hypothetical protein
MTIRHIVILNFKKGVHQDYTELLNSTKPLILQIPGIISYKIYLNESHYTPEDVISFGVELIFKDQEALNIFMEHPLHYEANAIFEKYLADPAYMVLTHELNIATSD